MQNIEWKPIKDYSNLIQELQCDRVEALKQIVNKNKEIERLNNIINEFDKYLVSVKNGCIYNVDVFLYKVVSNIYNKFKELKGDDKE